MTDTTKLPPPDLFEGVILGGSGRYMGHDDGYTATTVRRLIAEAVKKEREACAKVCLAIEDEPIPTAEAADADVAYGMGRSSGAERCAHAIRARSKEAGNG